MKNSLLCILIFVSLLLVQGCSTRLIETDRFFAINETHKTIRIYKTGYIGKLITAEGFFPDHKEGVTIFYSSPFAKKGKQIIFCCKDFRSKYSEVTSGKLSLDFEKNIAQVTLKPSETYHWLDLNGKYNISFE